MFDFIGLIFIVTVLVGLFAYLYKRHANIVDITPDLTMQALVNKTANMKGINNELAWVIVVSNTKKVRG